MNSRYSDSRIDVSIVVPVYNVSRYLDRLFTSILEQDFCDFEVIFIDDGSTDDSLSKCLKFKNKNTSYQISVVHQTNQGTSIARNVGLKKAKGKYIYFCDPDDYIDSTLLKENYYYAEKLKANVVIFGYYIEDIFENIIEKKQPRSEFYKSLKAFQKDFASLYDNGYLYFVWNKLYLRKSLKNLKFDNYKNGEDTRFNLIYYRNISRIYVNNRTYYHYTVNRPNSAQSNKSVLKASNRFREVTELDNLIHKYWNISDNRKLNDLVANQYIQTAFTVYYLDKDRNSKNSLSNRILNSNIVKTQLLLSKNCSLKYNIQKMIIRLRKLPGLMNLYKIYREIKNE